MSLVKKGKGKQRRPEPEPERPEKPAVDWEDAGLPQVFLTVVQRRAAIDAQIKELEAEKKDLGTQIVEYLEAVDEVKVVVPGVGKAARIQGESVTTDRQKLIKKFGVTAVEECTKRTQYWYARVYPEGAEEE